MLRNISLFLLYIDKYLVIPLFERNWMGNGGSIHISSFNVRYMATNRKAYILKRSLRVTTAGSEKTVSVPLEGRRFKLITEFSPE